jgi:hypothetical protein
LVNAVFLIGSLSVLSKSKLDICKKPLFNLGVGKLKLAVWVGMFLPALTNTSLSFTITSAVPLPNRALSPGSGYIPLDCPFISKLIGKQQNI